MKSADDLFGFARKCLADSGLPSKQTDELRTKINFIELNRDDKAHRFVVTWNAFLDGNRLAYLALAIAITIDSLVFMSGLFGANAVRSPLQDVPSMKARSAHQLEAIIENALLPDRFENARLVLGAMRPITQHDGYVARIVLHPEDPHAADIRRVLNAGSTIGAVRHIEGQDDAYEIRAELFEFLSIVAKKAFETDKKHVNQAELEKIVTVALMPDVGENAQVVLDSLHPITEDRGFMATIDLDKVDADHKRIVRSVLNAGSTLQVVQKVEKHAVCRRPDERTEPTATASACRVAGEADGHRRRRPRGAHRRLRAHQAWPLLRRPRGRPPQVGGISQTDEYKGYRFDIGGHRFFSKSDEVNALWKEILGDAFITRSRLSRIYCDRQVPPLPPQAPDAFRKLGPFRSTRHPPELSPGPPEPHPARADLRGLGRQPVRPRPLQRVLQVLHREGLGHAHDQIRPTGPPSGSRACRSSARHGPPSSATGATRSRASSRSSTTRATAPARCGSR